MRSLCLVLLLAAPTAAAGLLSPGGVAVLDAASGQRASFTNSERIVFQQKVFNGVASAGRIVFTFTVLSPAGTQALQFAGNAVPGSVGNAASQLSGFPIAKFYSGPGVYTLKAQAQLDGQTVEQSATFVVSSPNIMLIYPPNGAQNIADIPLTFRWVSSGGSTYKVTVGDNPSFYNSLFSQSTGGGDSLLSYPQNPPDPRQRLSAGQLYYWKVEGFDASGLKVAESAFPYSFTVQAAALSKDLAVTELTVDGGPAGAGGVLSFRAVVKNQGGSAQGNVPLRFSVGGLPAPGTPVMVALNPGETREFSFAAALPADQNQSLSIACFEFSDDNLPNNCKTLLVNKPAPSAGSGSDLFGDSSLLTADRIWVAIRELLRDRDIAAALDGYELVGMDGQLSVEELRELLDSLRQGQARVSLTGPPAAPGGGAAAARAAEPRRAAASEAAAAGPEEEASSLGAEWSGFGPAASPEAGGFVIKDAKSWNKTWRRLSRGKTPEVDFEKHMVAGVLVGRAERADSVEFESVFMELSGLVVRYRLLVHQRLVEPDGVRRAALRTTVPYYMRVMAKTLTPVRFEPLEEMKDEILRGPKEKKQGEKS